MLLCVVFWLQVSQVQFVRLRHVNEEQEEDHGHSQRVDTETECVDTVTDVCLCSDTLLRPSKTFLFVFAS